MINTKQQLLNLFDQNYEFNNFISLGNEITVASLQNFAHQFCHIYGSNNSGKSHLLKSWVNLANQKYNAGLYLTSSDLSEISVNDIDLDTYRFIAIDNVDHINEPEQIAIFDLFNKIRLANRDNYLLTSSTQNLNNIDIRSDLKTRLHSGVVFALKTMNEDDLLQALQIYTKCEQIKVSDSSLKYLLNHHSRSLGMLTSAIHEVSLVATQSKSAITNTLIKSILNLE
ncbi:MAG: DnaA/Hda family protein [Burkholderiales bacterium]|nr:DnaA/Hda family protein [Burkholderiales bacterium]